MHMTWYGQPAAHTCAVLKALPDVSLYSCVVSSCVALWQRLAESLFKQMFPDDVFMMPPPEREDTYAEQVQDRLSARIRMSVGVCSYVASSCS